MALARPRGLTRKPAPRPVAASPRQSQDLVAVPRVELFETFAKALAAYSRIKDIRSAGTAVALLTKPALREIAAEPAVGTPEG